jgi:hypothetical protein
MYTQCYSLFSIPAGCHRTQQDGESIPSMKKQALSNLSIKSIYMQYKALLVRKLFVIFETNYRRICVFNYTFLKVTVFPFWLIQYSINKFRFQLIKITGVLSQVSTKTLILRGYINFFKVLAGFNSHIQELAKTHKFLFGHYPNGIGLRTDAWTTNNNNK